MMHLNLSPGLLLAPRSSIAQQLANASPWSQSFPSNHPNRQDHQVFHMVFVLGQEK